MRALAVSVLHIVEAVRICFPDVHANADHRFASKIKDLANDKEWLSVGVTVDVLAIGVCGSIVCMEWTEYSAFSRVRRLWVIDGIDQEGQSQHVREEDKFLYVSAVWPADDQASGSKNGPDVCSYTSDQLWSGS